MTAEHRDTPRFALSLDAEFGQRGNALRPCRIRDISHGGAFLVTAATPGLSGSPMDLVVHITRDGRTHRVRYETLVARQADDGVGVFFCGTGVPGFIPLPDLIANRRRGSSA
jgi:hypothetical protein